MEVEDIPFLETILFKYKNTEKITIESQGNKYLINRYCPHQGADLTNATIINNKVICPNHHWEFDLLNNGDCINASASLYATEQTQDIEDIGLGCSGHNCSNLTKKEGILTLLSKHKIVDSKETVVKFTFKINKNVEHTYDEHFILNLKNNKEIITRSYSQVDHEKNIVSFYIKIYKNGQFTRLMNQLNITSKQ